MENNCLLHYGIKGQKWGIRRFQRKDGGLTPAGKKRYADDDYHEDYRRAHNVKSVRTMSDQELRNRLNRLQMESQYKQMTASKLDKGKKIVMDVLENAGKETAKKYVSKYMSYEIDRIISEIKNKRNTSSSNDINAIIKKTKEKLDSPKNDIKSVINRTRKKMRDSSPI